MDDENLRQPPKVKPLGRPLVLLAIAAVRTEVRFTQTFREGLHAGGDVQALVVAEGRFLPHALVHLRLPKQRANNTTRKFGLFAFPERTEQNDTLVP